MRDYADRSSRWRKLKGVAHVHLVDGTIRPKDTVRHFVDEVEGFDSAFLLVMNGHISKVDAERFIRLFATRDHGKSR